MKKLSIRILGSGTSQGVPVIGCKCTVCNSKDPRDKRLRASAIFELDGKQILIDAGPDLRYQFLRSDYDNVEAVLISHEHNDHVAGLDDLRPINFLHRKHISIYAEERVRKALTNSFSYIFNPAYAYPGKPMLNLCDLTNNPFEISGMLIQPIRVHHGELPIFGFRVGGIAYLTDIKTIDDVELAKLQGLDVLFLTALHHKRHHSHLNLEEALEMAERINARQTYLFHMSHRMGLHAEMDLKLPKGVNFAYDELLVSVPYSSL